MKLTKILALTMALLMSIAVFAGCGSKEDTNSDKASSQEATGFAYLDGKSVAYQSGTISDDIVNDLKDKGEIDCTTYSNEKVTQCFSMLENGEVDTVMCDSPVAEGYLAKQPGVFKILWKQEDAPEQFAFALKKGDADMKKAIDAALEELKVEGFLDACQDKWFGSGKDVVMPAEKSATIDTSALNLMNAKTLTFGAEIGYPPFEDYAEDGTTPIGFDIDLAKAVSIKLGLEFKFVNTAFDTILAGIGTNYDVVVSAVTINAERQESVDFSTPYINSYQAITVKAK